MMEAAVRDIVSKLGVNVATKKLVCREYCKVNNIQKLSSSEKEEVHRIFGCLVEELAANPETLINKHGSPLSSTPGSVHKMKSVTDGLVGPEEIKGISYSEANKIIHNEYLSCIKVLSEDQKENDNVTGKDTSSICTKKRVLKRLKSKDVMDSVLDSGDEKKVFALHCTSPKIKKFIQDKFADEDWSTLRERSSQKTCQEVVDSILYSDSDASVLSHGGFTSPMTTPTKSVKDCEADVCEDSPLLNPKSLSKRKFIHSDSESDVDENSTDERTKCLSSMSPSVRPNTVLKRRRIQVASDSDSDSENDFCNNVPSNITSAKVFGRVCQTRMEKRDSGVECKRTGGTPHNDYSLVMECKVVVEDCLRLGTQDKVVNKAVKRNLNCSNKHASRKQIQTCSSDDLDHGESSEAKVLSCHSLNGKISEKVEADDMRKDSSSSSDSLSDTSTSRVLHEKMSGEMETDDILKDDSSGSDSLSDTGVSRVKHVNRGGKTEKRVKQKPTDKRSKKVESKRLKDLRAICRHVGVILRNTIELQGCDTDGDKVKRITYILQEKGMKGRPTMKSAEQFKLERELKELGVDSNNAASKSPVKGSRRRACRERDFPPKSSPAVSVRDDFSHLKDIFCADDSSD